MVKPQSPLVQAPLSLSAIACCSVVCLLAASSGASAAAVAVSGPPAPLAAETSDVASLPAAGPHRIWVEDGFTGSAQVIDGDTGELKATISGASLSSFSADPGQLHIYVAESIWSKGNRGQRQDLVSIYDGTSLKLTGEIALPGRAYVVPLRQVFALSSNGSRAYVYNMEPSSSVVVVDLLKKAVVRTVETPGCALAFPWGTEGFSSLCGDGSLATVTSGGPKPTIVRSASFFDAEHDPVFEDSPTDPATGQTFFVTYSGMVHPVQLGPQPKFAEPWSLQQAAELPLPSISEGALAWRPGGTVPMALHKPSGKLYVLMHAGEHWTQKKDGAELWIIDTATRKVLRRAALEDEASAVAISQDDHPLLYLMNGKSGLSIRDAGTLEELRHVDEGGFARPMVPGS